MYVITVLRVKATAAAAVSSKKGGAIVFKKLREIMVQVRFGVAWDRNPQNDGTDSFIVRFSKWKVFFLDAYYYIYVYVCVCIICTCVCVRVCNVLAPGTKKKTSRTKERKIIIKYISPRVEKYIIIYNIIYLYVNNCPSRACPTRNLDLRDVCVYEYILYLYSINLYRGIGLYSDDVSETNRTL